MDSKEKKEIIDLHPKILYQPKEVKKNQIWHFKKLVENKYGVKLNDYWELYEWSRQNYPEFWECVWIFFDIISSEPYTEVYNKTGSLEDTDWFKGAKINYAENVLRFRSSKDAIITSDEHDSVERISYEQLYAEVATYAEALKDSGVKKGDVVTCYMSNKVEAVYVYLAAASMGAIWCAALPFLGAKAVVSRFEQLHPKILFTAGKFHFDGKQINMVEKLPNIIKNLPSLMKVIFVPSKQNKEEVKDLPGCVSVEDFLRPAREKISKHGVNLVFEQVPFVNPLCVNFTSGTTGAPKAIVHSHGALLAPLRDFGLFWDCTKDDVLLLYALPGGIMWNMHVSSLCLGLTLVMYDGLPFEETPTRLWDLVDKFGITSTFIRNSSAEVMVQKKYVPTEKHSLRSLRALYPSIGASNPQTFELLTKAIKPGLFCCSNYGCTEYFGNLSGLDTNLPVYKGEIQCFALGYDLRTVDEKGNYIIGQRGDLVQLNPAPTAPISSLGADPKKKLNQIYLSKYPGAWDTGDDTWINPVTKGFFVYGRSGDSMNPKGAKFNYSEIYFALEGFPGIVDSVCVSHFNSKLDERVVLFVSMAPGYSLTPGVEDKIRKTIEDDLSYEHVPSLIMAVPGVPYNMNGKKLNNLVKKLINKQSVPNSDVVLNPSSVEFFKNLELGDF